MLSQIFSDGYARAGLDAKQAALLADLYGRLREFFASDDRIKIRYASNDFLGGYRPTGFVHAGDPQQPDMNDSFIYWDPDRSRKIPHAEEVQWLLKALDAYRQGVAMRIVADLVRELCDHYDHAAAPKFEECSVLQCNSFGVASDREFLQTCHEDGVAATVIWTSGQGLEGCHEMDGTALLCGPEEVLVMPGSVLEVMTGGEVRSFYHKVRNHRDLERKSIMYFASFDISRGPIKPFVVNDENREIDIRELIRSGTDTFGLVKDFVLGP
ncbi:hypothetical protein ETD83_33010 [Actinomadura soli]|uniref:Isopenicillin N synthase-like Fe(2+) 2OG dioxygenase domain-containing protein n=1 Tax=Actinomadura soli TaxID=2508997 RepID=A0A5C4J422_9ACTN|nr:2OG-Fe(II) oxygenase family protein [Actinomadura soli]TMQ90974.1 hypothetical protein ETD83_33010 [Actinomadura soli]